LHPRRRDDRPDPGRPAGRARGRPRPARGPVHDDDERVALRDGRPDAHARAQRPEALPRGLRPRRRWWGRHRSRRPRRGSSRQHHQECAMTLTPHRPAGTAYAPEPDLGTPTVETDVTVRVTVDDREVEVPAGTSVLR